MLVSVSRQLEDTMSSKKITSFFKAINVTESGLPTPASSAEKKVNKEVESAIISKQKRGTYGDYSPETGAKIVKYAIENGNSKAAKHFGKLLGRNINESTVRGIKSSYSKRRCLETSVDATCMNLP